MEAVWRHRPLFCLLVLWSAVAAARADQPRLMLNTGGPVGGIRTLAFSADGTQLYAAGSGKVVNVWKLAGTGDALQAIPADPLRWEVARGMRGRIYTLDVDRNSGAMAIGGFSARSANGDLAVFNPGQQKIESVLPRERPDVIQPGQQPGHLQTVCSVRFSPSGRQMVSMSIDGEVRLWTNKGADSVVLQAADPQSRDGRTQSAAFLGERRVVFPRRDQTAANVWRLAVVDPANLRQPPVVLQQPTFSNGVSATALSLDGREFAAADHAGDVTLFPTAGPLTLRPLNRPQIMHDGVPTRRVASLAYGPDGLLAITTSADTQGVCWLELWNTSVDPPQMMQEHELGLGETAYAAAFRPGERLLAVTPADRSAVLLIPLRDGPEPLAVANALELSGRGRVPHAVNFVGTDSYRIATVTPADEAQQQQDRLQFDLQTLEVIKTDRNEKLPEASRPTDVSGWRLVAQPVTDTDRQELQLLAPGTDAVQCSAVLETDHQGTYRTHTWLTDENGAVYGVAVATDRQDGIFLYDLPANGRCRLLRYLRDHTDAILSLSVSWDGRYLVSSSKDETIKVWSLAGLRGVNAKFPREDAWGATFGSENGRVVVTSALGAGIAVHRDLLTGDVITQVNTAGLPAPVTDVNTILQVLANTPLWQNVQVTSRRDGQPRPDRLIVPGWEPVATLFVDRSGEWAMWTPQGVYDSSASGDALFGWHINVGRDQTPQYFRAEKFRRELEQPEVMRQLLRSGSLQDALIALAVAVPRAIDDLAADIPQLRLINPPSGANIGAGEEVTVQAAIRYPVGRDSTEYQLRLWMNQRDDGTTQEVEEVDGEFVYTWSVPAEATQNRVLVEIEESPTGVDAPFHDAQVQVSADVEEPEIAVHLFSLSADDYPGIWSLANCNNDADGVAALLDAAQKRFRPGERMMLSDRDGRETVQREAVEAKIAEFKAKLAKVPSHDILLVFVAGHGQAFGSGYYFVPPDGQLAGNLNERQLEAVIADRDDEAGIGIPWQMLQSLAEVNCRKVFVLDTCYSGNVAEVQKQSQRPLMQAQAMVFAATAANQTARDEDSPLEDHGLFTGYLLHGTAGNADGVKPSSPVHPRFVPLADGKINLKELVSYVSDGVRQASFSMQEPTFAPVELLNFVNPPLFDAPRVRRR